MMASLPAFVDELEKIAWEAPSKDELKNLAKNVAVYGAGLGVGGGLGYAARQKLLPKLLQNLSPRQATVLTVGTGAMGGLVSAAALKKALSGLREEPSES